jgi:phage terminase Nu1 subunit (DNA packaging protein)
MDNDYAAGDYAHDMEQETLYAQARTRLAQEDKP